MTGSVTLATLTTLLKEQTASNATSPNKVALLRVHYSLFLLSRTNSFILKALTLFKLYFMSNSLLTLFLLCFITGSGDWVCRECTTNNFARRQSCFGCSRRKEEVFGRGKTHRPYKGGTHGLIRGELTALLGGNSRPYILHTWFLPGCTQFIT